MVEIAMFTSYAKMENEYLIKKVILTSGSK